MNRVPAHQGLGRGGVPLFLVMLLALSNMAVAGERSTAPQPSTLLLEARSAASSIEDPTARSSTLERVVLAQVPIDPAGARDTLKTFPTLPNKLNHLASLAAAYAETGRIDDAEHMYAEIRIEDRSSRLGKLAAANARGYVAVAYANAGKMEEAFRLLSQLKDQSKDEPLAIVGIATAKLAEAQARQGDIQGALQTAVTIANENPYPLMNIVGGRVRAGNLQEALAIVAGLEDTLQPYGTWGIVESQTAQGHLTQAQVTATAMKPGHAKAHALLTLATHHMKAGTHSLALLLLQEAAAAATSTVNNSTRADTLWHIAAALAEAGDPALAIETAKSIDKDGHRRSAIHDIVKLQAKNGDTKGAFNTALMLTSTSESDAHGSHSYVLAITDVVVELARAGRAKDALDLLARFEDLKAQSHLPYSRIAGAQADRGDIQAARTTLSLIETKEQRTERKKELADLAQRLKENMNSDDRNRLSDLRTVDQEIGWALESIAKAQARKGALRDALATAGELTEPSERSRVIEAIGESQVSVGRTRQALEWGRALHSATDRVHALIGIARGLTASKDRARTKSATAPPPSTAAGRLT